MKSTKPKVNPIPIEALSMLGHAEAWARELREHGLRHPYGLYPAQPTSPALTRDLLVIERAVKRIAERDRPNR